MRRWAALVALGVSLVACEGGEIAIFTANQTGMGGASGDAGVSGAASAVPAGAAGIAAAGASAGSGGGGDQSGGGGAGAGATDPPCQSNADCENGYFCSKQRCQDDRGSCLLTGFPNEMLDLQVCGCDNFTYWNDSYRQEFGIAASTMGPCNSAPYPCRQDIDCGDPDLGYRCEHRVPPNLGCGLPPKDGRCWVAPLQCPAALSSDKQYQVCSPPNNPGGTITSCVTKCEAIQSGHPFTQLSHDQACP